MDELYVANERAILGPQPERAEAEVVALFPGARVFHRESSVGAVFGLELPDRRRVAVKVHRIESGILVQTQRVQKALADAGFPAPRPLLPPTPIGARLATAEEWLDGERADARDPEVRRILARALRRSIELAPAADLPRPHPREQLWPEPHNALFDFDASTAGAEWIDEIGARARARMSLEPLVVGHADWSAKHFRFRDGALSAVYDWDSLRLETEPSLVGWAAATHTAALDVLDCWRPEVADAASFLADYGCESDAAAAAAVYAIAYAARCEHALAAAGVEEFVTDARAALPEFADVLL